MKFYFLRNKNYYKTKKPYQSSLFNEYQRAKPMYFNTTHSNIMSGVGLCSAHQEVYKIPIKIQVTSYATCNSSCSCNL